MAAATANLSTYNSSSFIYGVIYWEWLQDTGNWQPYDPEVVTFIEQNYGKSNFASLGAINPSLSLYKIDFTSNPPNQIRMDTGRKRCVRRRVHPVTNPTNHQCIWKWEGDFPGIWNTYDFDVSTMIEDVYQAQNSHFLDLSQTSLKMPYFIDLKNLQQVRIETGKCRGIRREQLSVPYPLCNYGNQLMTNPLGAMIPGQKGHNGTTVQQAPSHPNPTNPSSSNPVSFQSYGSNSACNNNSTFSTNPALGKHQLNGSDSSDSDDGSKNSSNPQLNSACKRLRSASHRNQSSLLTNGAVSMSNGLQSSSFLPSNMVYNFGNLASPLSVTNMIGNGSNHSGLGNQPMQSTSTYTNPVVLQQSSGSLYPSQYTGMLTSSPFLNSLSNSSTAVNSSYSSTGPLTRQQFSLLQYRSGMQGAATLPTSTPASSANLFSGVSNGIMNLKGHGSKITPVVSNITNVLTSPIVPAAFSQQPAPLPGNFQPSSGYHVSSSFSSPSSASFPDKNRIVLPKIKKSKGGKSGTDMPVQYFKPVVKPAEDEDCCICCEKLNTESAYGKSNHPDGEVISLSLCDHMFHRQCLQAMYDSGPKDGSVQCPSCKKIHGYKHGVCPAGEMCYWVKPESLPGCESCSTICVSYSIRPGTQGPEHPNPGKKFSARGFPRTGYLPNNEKGRKVLKLFTVAWQRRIMFTIGTSSTTGETDTVTWNEIHHKTEFNSNDYGHGYPDPNYLDNVMLELAVQGVTEEDLNDT